MKTDNEMKTDQELKQLAKDFVHDKVFSTRHEPLFSHPENASQVFMPLVFMDKKAMDAFIAKKPEMLYEYLDKAGPRSVNGMPGFTSFQWLNQEEYLKFAEYHNKYKEAEAKV